MTVRRAQKGLKMVVEPGCCLLYGGLAPPRLDSSPVSGYGACFRSLEWRVGWWGPFIPDRSPGHAFVPIARAGTPGYENLGRWAVEVFAVTGAAHTPPLDSRFRENDEFGGRG